MNSNKTEDKKEKSEFVTNLLMFLSLTKEKFSIDPLTKKRIMRFKRIRRAYISFLIMVATLVVAIFAEILINKRPLVMNVDGSFYFPIYGKMNYNKDFHFAEDDNSEVNYRDFKKYLKESGRGWLILPIVPYDAFEVDKAEAPLALTFKVTPSLGIAVDKDSDQPSASRTDYYWVEVGAEDGVKHAVIEGDVTRHKYTWVKYSETSDSSEKGAKVSDHFSEKKVYIGFAWNKSSSMESDDHTDYTWFKVGTQNNVIKQPDGKYTWVRYASDPSGLIRHPLPPSFKNGHFLGTDRIGRDILARLVYGYRIAIFFSLLYVSITFFMGVVIGVLMGYYGATFDTVLQRFIEIWEQIPFLYMVMILSAIFAPSFAIFLLIFVLFGWTGKTWTARAMTYRERERDYILAARSMGASTWRIVSVHVVPNIIVIILTSLPFAISGGISSLTSLDFLGYGLRPPTPSWGELLNIGIATFKDAPWILSSITTAMVCILVMITFIGEGLRDAFDPRRFTVYR
ncbi:MAG: ABC transporter permease subunit [Treponema sp.]